MAEPHRLDEAARAARSHVALDWDRARTELLLTRTKARARRRAWARGSVAAAASVLLALGVHWAWPRDAPREGHPTAPVVARGEATAAERPSDDGVIHLADGSRVVPLESGTEVVVMRVADDGIELDLVRGAARFEVVPGLPRAFEVAAGEVRVSVVGTVFDVRREPGGARVEVLEGRVRVRWPPDGDVELGPGQSDRFPRTRAEGVRREPAEAPTASREPREPSVATEPSARSAPAEGRARRPRERLTETAPSTPVWVALAERGEHQEAARLLDDDALDGADLRTLLLASDTMRLAGRPERALAYLDRAEQVAQGDARAPLVSFTRGRLLLTSLDRPRDAADAFHRARTLAPEGAALAMDAHAREVEALARAGDAALARARAEEYVERYPNGLQRAAVRRWGGLAP